SAKNVNGGKGGKGGDGIVSPSSTLVLGDITTSGGKGGKGGIGYNSPFSVYPPSVGGDGGDGGIGLNVGSSLTTQAKGKITATGGDGGYGGMGGKGGNPPPTGVITSASDGSSGGTGGCGGNGVLSPDLVTALKSVAVAAGGMGGKGGKGGKSGGDVGGANGLAGAAHNGNLGGAGGTGGAGGAKGAEAAAGTDDELNVNTAVINNISAVAAPHPAILAGGTLNNHGGVQLTNPPLLSNDTLKFAVTGHDVAQAAAHYYHALFSDTTLFLSSIGGKYGLSLQSKLSPLFSVAGSAQYLNGADYNIASLMQAIAAYSVNAWAHYSQYSENEDTNILAALHPASVAGGYQLAIRRLSPYGFGQNNSEYALALATATTVTADVQQAMSVANVASLTVASQYSIAQINQNLFSTLNGISGKAFTLTMTPMSIGQLTGSPIADVAIGASTGEPLKHDLGAGTTGMSAWRNTQAGKVIDDRPMCDFSITDENGKKIENFGGESIFFGIPYTLKQGEDASRLFAVYLDENGKAVSIANSFYSIADNMIYGRADHSGIYSIGYNANVSKFTDITEHWAQGDINFVLTRGLMTGTAKTLFSPDGEITKEDFVKALSVIAGKDVSNIIKGDKKQTLKRQEMAELMLQFIKATGHEISDIREEMKFTDTSDQAVKAMQMAGIIMGKDTTFFDPDSPVTRAQAAAVFRRYVGLLLSGNSPSQGFDMTDSGELVLYSDGKLVKGTKTFGNVKLDFDKQGICIKIETVPDNKKYVTHKLAYGDTLWDLSKKYNCTVEEITQLNGINNPRSVPIGTELKIPQK
ncbi:MAG: S-layer homology domain-containing protein, partial [Oscillospiraceae bacterium]